MFGAWGVQTALDCPSPVRVHGDWSDSKHQWGHARQGRARRGCMLLPWRPSLTYHQKHQSVPAGIFLFLFLFLPFLFFFSFFFFFFFFFDGNGGPFYLLSILSEKGSGFKFL